MEVTHEGRNRLVSSRLSGGPIIGRMSSSSVVRICPLRLDFVLIEHVWSI